MQTHLSKNFLATEEGELANKILRSCVHCGFCTATCPTYQVLGDELDGPRGRIYQIKQMLEDQEVSRETLKHLDQCLTCRSCETTCPSGVEFTYLLEIGRKEIKNRVRRASGQSMLRKILLGVLPYPQRFALLLKTARLFRPVLPGFLRKKIPEKTVLTPLSLSSHNDRYLVLEGCVQASMSPGINHATRKVLDKLEIELNSLNKCCGAIQQHLSDETNALNTIKQNIDHILDAISNGAKGLVVTASGCGAMYKDYPHLLRNDAEYYDKAVEVANKTFDLSEVIDIEKLKPLLTSIPEEKIALHTPCTLQHAQKLPNALEDIFKQCDFNLVPVANKHLCCGSAGTYSITQPKLAAALQEKRLGDLQQHKPDVILTANIGCLHHLNEDSDVPVKHWIEVIADSIE